MDISLDAKKRLVSFASNFYLHVMLPIMLLAAMTTGAAGQQKPAAWTLRLYYGGGAPQDSRGHGHCMATFSSDGKLTIAAKGRRGVSKLDEYAVVYQAELLKPEALESIVKSADAALKEKPYKRRGSNEDGYFLRLEREGRQPARNYSNQMTDFDDALPAMRQFVLLVNELFPETERIPIKYPQGVATSDILATLPKIPAGAIGEKRELLFADDFEGAEPAKEWHKVVATFVVEKGTLKGTQTRDKDIPAAEGKPAVKAHAAVHGLEVPTKDSIVEVRIRFEGASMIDVEFDDRKYTGAHYGHICRAQVRLDGVTLIDERDGSMRNDIYALKNDPAKKAEVAKLLIGRRVTYQAKLTAGKWYTLVVETVGDEMRVTIDGEPAGYLKSSGIGHATKSKIELGVAGKDGFFDDIKVWNAEGVKR